MKKTVKRWRVLICFTVIAMFLTAGCGKKATPENLLTDMEKNMKDVKSFEAEMNIGCAMKTEEGKMELGINMDMQATTDPQAGYIDGSIDINYSGMNMDIGLEVYQVKEKKEDVTYMKMMEQWMRVVADEEEKKQFDSLANIGGMSKMADQFTLAEKTTKVEGRECFELTGSIKGETFSDIMNQEITSSLDAFGMGGIMDEDSIKKLEIPCTIDISKSDILPVRIYMDMKDVFDQVKDSVYEDENVEVDEYYMEILYKGFDGVEKIVVPDDVKKAAVDVAAEVLEESLEENENPGSANQEPAEQSGELGSSWDSYTVQVNEKVLTFPCTLADVEAAGVQLESEYNPRDLMVEAGDYEFAFFGDANGNSIAFELSNPEDKAKKLEECIVTGVSVDDYSVGNGGLTIIFPGGIQIGTEKAAVIEKYGETEEVYEGEHSHSYTWYDPEYYYKYCEIDFDPESGKVMSMDLTCTEF